MNAINNHEIPSLVDCNYIMLNHGYCQEWRSIIGSVIKSKKAWRIYTDCVIKSAAYLAFCRCAYDEKKRGGVNEIAIKRLLPLLP